MSVGRSRQGTNQAGALAPLVSPWGQALFAQTSQLIDQPRPIGRQGIKGMTGNVGAMVTTSAAIRTVATTPGYFGDAPQSLQGTVSAPDPWKRV